MPWFNYGNWHENNVDTKTYIESGIIESYVLGLASAEEAAELELLCMQHQEIKNAVDEFSLTMERTALANAVTPPGAVKERLMSALAGEFFEEEKPSTSVIPLHTPGAPARMPRIAALKYFAAASVILLLGSTILNFYLYNSYRAVNTRYEALLTDRNSLQANNDVFRTKLDDLEKSFRVIQNPDVKVITLNGTKGRENNLAAVYWDTKTKDVYFLPTRMEVAPSDKQYQLWAIVDGKPVDAGVVGDCNGLCRMKNVPKAEAFAITLEKKGGRAVPTLSAMYVMGKT
jgi:anti-sigma-K factor RskA